ncbi:hypothetical protein [Bacillus marinisedimentorum]|nr:hypothetical protein [Bacillus marinisedimentorum]
MTKHSGGRLGKAGKTLSNPKSTKGQKKKASKTLNDHKKKKH